MSLYNQYEIFTYIFVRICHVANGASFAVDALPEGGREDLSREFFGVAETGGVNWKKKIKLPV